MAECRACQSAEVEWAVTDRGRTMLVNPPTDDGNLYAWRTVNGTLRVTANKPHRQTVRVTSHFATCPQADKFRSPR